MLTCRAVPGVMQVAAVNKRHRKVLYEKLTLEQNVELLNEVRN